MGSNMEYRNLVIDNTNKWSPNLFIYCKLIKKNRKLFTFLLYNNTENIIVSLNIITHGQ